MNKKYKIGISMGDVNGIGPEVILKALDHESMLRNITPIIYGSFKGLSYHRNTLKNVDVPFINTKDVTNASHSKVNVINCQYDDIQFTLGKATADSGKLAIASLDRMVKDAKQGRLDAIITAPINKHAMQLAGWNYFGHTEFFGDAFGVKDQLMFMVSENLKIATVTGHMPLKDVTAALNKEKIASKIALLNTALKQDFGVEKPVIAVLGLNPHAGDDGTLGSEEKDFITPLLIEMKKNGLIVTGPYPADGFFGSGMFGKPDGILAMYHDQGLIPFKALTFNEGVNYTAGLPIVRTSPDHGTAYDLAGKDAADPRSFRSAIRTAIRIIRNREDFGGPASSEEKNKPKQQANVEE